MTPAVVPSANPTPAVTTPEVSAPAAAAPETIAPASSAPAQATPASAATREAALAFVGRPASELVAALGAPSSTAYAPSCLGSGEDGEWFYDGFTVYTYREGDVETIQDVL